MYSIWVESSLNQLSDIKGIIKTLSDEEDKEYFDPHVTLVTNLKTELQLWMYLIKYQRRDSILHLIQSKKERPTFNDFS